MDRYLAETSMLNLSNPAIQRLIAQRSWCSLGEFERIKAIYNYVRDEILFGYNTDDGILETAKANHLNPETYLRHLLTTLPQRQANDPECAIDDLLPWSDSIQKQFKTAVC